MKKTVLLSLCSFATLLAVQTINAQVIADWTFETAASTNNIIGAGLTPSSTQSGVLADIGTGTASAFHATATTAWSTPVGHGSAHSWSANNWSINDYYQFSVSTLGYSGISLYWEQTSSSTGPGNFSLQYSTDNVTYTPFLAYLPPANSGNNVWSNSIAGAGETASEFSVDLSSITALDNQANVYFRLVDTSALTPGGGAVGTAGTDRVDDFTVIVPEPTTLALAGLGGLSLMLLRRQRN